MTREVQRRWSWIGSVLSVAVQPLLIALRTSDWNGSDIKLTN